MSLFGKSVRIRRRDGDPMAGIAQGEPNPSDGWLVVAWMQPAGLGAEARIDRTPRCPGDGYMTCWEPIQDDDVNVFN